MAQQLTKIPLVAPGFRGLDTERADTLVTPDFAAELSNAVIDSSGRVASRPGYVDQVTGTAPGDTVETLFEWIQADGSTGVVLAWDGGMSDSITDPGSNDISGSVTDTNGTWQFVNFNDYVVGFQDGQAPIDYNDSDNSGNFATVGDAANAPTGGIGLAAWGRLWGVDSDGVTINYCALLDQDDWSGAGAGSLNMEQVWPAGSDRIVALAAFNNRLVVFGTRQIVFWEDTTGSALGFNPTQAFVVDFIIGTGCVSRFTVQQVGEDLVFLSPNGVQRLGRLVQEKSNPRTSLSARVASDLAEDIDAEAEDSWRSYYDRMEQRYVLSSPTQGRSWVFEFRHPYLDPLGNEVVPVMTWEYAPTAWAYRENGDVLNGVGTVLGLVSGNDDDGTDFIFAWRSPWLAISQEAADRLKILKRIGSIVFSQGATTLTYEWFWDFSTTGLVRQAIIDASTAAEWGSAEWGEDEWSGGVSLRRVKVAGAGTGQFIQLRFSVSVPSTQVAVQEIDLYTKLGRMA